MVYIHGRSMHVVAHRPRDFSCYPCNAPTGLFSLAPDLLLLLWPVFFVAAARQSPHLKVRNFRKSVTKGFARRDRQENAADTGEAKPEWDSVDAVPCEQVRASAIIAKEIQVRFTRAVPRHSLSTRRGSQRTASEAFYDRVSTFPLKRFMGDGTP